MGHTRRPIKAGDSGQIHRYARNIRLLDKTSPAKGGEIQLTDGLKLLLEKQPIYAYRFEGTRCDTCMPLGFFKAPAEFALNRPDIGARFLKYLRHLNLTD